MLINKQDLHNIKQQIAIGGVARHKEDHISISMMVDELQQTGKKDSAVYKPRAELLE